MKIMKVLKIESNGIPKFTSDGKEWKNTEDIQKEDIASMLDFCIDHDVVLEGYDDELIKNPVQKIIYENIYNKFKAFIGEKDNFIDEVDGLYKDALEKYRVN